MPSRGPARRLSAELRARLTRSETSPSDPADPRPAEVADPADLRIVDAALPLTMTSVERLLALIDAVRHCHLRGIAGDLAECGVWRGGSVLAMILTLQDVGADPRHIHLFDTFEGMTKPTAADTSTMDRSALEEWDATAGRPYPELFDREAFNEAAVRETLLATGYPADHLHFVRGDVAATIPAAAPEELALLRLDTDWYESTRHELVHLYPRLREGGVLIVDDYGHWEGCRRAVDEYFSTEAEPVLLSRVDYTARMAVKR